MSFLTTFSIGYAHSSINKVAELHKVQGLEPLLTAIISEIDYTFLIRIDYANMKTLPQSCSCLSKLKIGLEGMLVTSAETREEDSI